MLEALRGLTRDDRVLGSGVDHEVLRRGVVHLRADDDLLVHETEVDGVEPILRAGIRLKRHPLPERAQEPDFGARPVRLFAVILVREQIDVVRVRARRFLVFVHPLVDGADRVMDFEVAGRELQRRLRLAHRVVQLRPRGERAAPSRDDRARVRGRPTGRPDTCSPRPERARTPTGHRRTAPTLRGSSDRPRQLLGLVPCEIELRDPQGGRNDPDARAAHRVGRRGFESVPVRVERIDEPPFGVQQIPQLQLNFRHHGGRRRIGAKNEGARGEHCRDNGHSEGSGHVASTNLIGDTRFAVVTRITPFESGRFARPSWAGVFRKR